MSWDTEAEDLQEPAESSERRVVAVPAGLHNERLDRALAQLVPEFSRNYLSQLIRDRAVRVNDEFVQRPARRVRLGEQLELELRPPPSTLAFVPQALPLDVVHEDEHLLVVNKPAGLVVHPAPGHWGGTLLNALLARDPAAAHLPRAGIVHRLDMDTSGLLVVARTELARRVLVEQLAAREVHREYVALAHGVWRAAPRIRVDAAIGRDPRHRLRMAVLDPVFHTARPALTFFELLQNAEAGCLLRCRLHSGRTHQIRVHLAHLRHPLVADGLYGGAPAAGMTRQALHAARLSFRHPEGGRLMEFVQPLPADLAAALACWGLKMPSLADWLEPL